MDNSKYCNRNNIHANRRDTNNVSYQSLLGFGKQQQRSHIKRNNELCSIYKFLPINHNGSCSRTCYVSSFSNSEGVWINL